MTDMKYLQLLSKDYPTIESACTEIINLNSILCLPKGTEYFFSDLHGEHEAFIHLLRSASGVIRAKIESLFGKILSEQERRSLAVLIYYPKIQIAQVKKSLYSFPDWCELTIYRLVQVLKEVASKYTRSKVRKTLPGSFSYVIDELLHSDDGENKEQYYSEIIHSIIRIGMAEQFIRAVCLLIRQLSIDYLHIIGDIFDRGPRADKIMDALMHYHDVDIQWGNHDISWLGACAGNLACIANVLRIAISYNNFDLLEDGYGINLRALSMFAAETYRDDPCSNFAPHILDENKYDRVDSALAAKMHKAIAVIQFKLEGQLVLRHPEYEMNDRLMLSHIDFKTGTIELGGKTYALKDTLFPTIDPKDPHALSKEEQTLMNTIAASFHHSEALNRHISYLYSHGSMYKCINSNLLYHGCIPMTDQGDFETLTFPQGQFSGKALLDYIDTQVRNAHYSSENTDAIDLMWYLWCGPKSPVYGKDKMTTFERYFIEDKSLQTEQMNPYYRWSEEQKSCETILLEFGLDPESSHIINGHVPVRQGESPVKANGKLFVIDGGISKAYQSKTGIAGYTLIYNSHHLALAEHMPFQPPTKDSVPETDTKVKIVEVMKRRVTVADTDIGKRIAAQISDLEQLLAAYRAGTISERT